MSEFKRTGGKFGVRLMAVAAGLTWAGLAAGAEDFEYHGYLRSGVGVSRGGTDQACFRAAGTEGASGKFRLGNECETYGEMSLVKYHLFNKSRDAAHFSTHITLSLVSGAERDWEPTDGSLDSTGKAIEHEFTLALRETFVQGVNLWGKDGPSVWAGKRFYRRHDLHVLDYYLINNAGPGVGFENIGAGPGKLHVAAVRNLPKGGKEEGPAQTNIDLRLSDIKAGGTLETVLIHGTAGARDARTGEESWEPVSGTQLALIHNGSAGPLNTRVYFQYGQGLYGGIAAWRASGLSEMGAWGSQNIAKDDDDAVKARKKSRTVRVAADAMHKLTSTIDNDIVLLWQDVDFGGAKDGFGDKMAGKNELTFGMRPAYHLSDTTSVALEVGSTTVKNAFANAGATKTEYKDSQLTKITLAPQFTAGPDFYARPQLRFFLTHASWNEDSKGQIGGPVYAKDTNGFSAGAQVEAWW